MYANKYRGGNHHGGKYHRPYHRPYHGPYYGGGYGHRHFGHGYRPGYGGFYFSNFGFRFGLGFGFRYCGGGIGLGFGIPLFGLNYFGNPWPAYCAAYTTLPYYGYYAAPVQFVSTNIIVPETVLVEPASVIEPAEFEPEPEVGQPPQEAVQGSADGPVIAADGHAAEFQRLAEEAFREHRYEDAARLVNHALVEDGENGKLHLFASQTFFALGEYQAAAAAIQTAASLLDRQDWGFVVQNFKKFYRGRDYVTHMEKLVEFMKENPDQPYAHFLRGYHYKYLGYDKSARKQLEQAMQLESRDQLAAELFAMAGGQLPEMAEAVKPVPDEPQLRETEAPVNAGKQPDKLDTAEQVNETAGSDSNEPVADGGNADDAGAADDSSKRVG